MPHHTTNALPPEGIMKTRVPPIIDPQAAQPFTNNAKSCFQKWSGFVFEKWELFGQGTFWARNFLGQEAIILRHSGGSRNPGRQQWINDRRYAFWQARKTDEWKRKWKLESIESVNPDWRDL
jgi:hypothetical protein